MFVAGVALVACAPELRPAPGQQILCAADDECPAGFACAENVGRCVAGGGCVLDDGSGDAVADGSPCDEPADGVCVGGVCLARFCGDGVVDVVAGEGCDPRFDPACRDDCTQPYCGDGVLDLGESCDGDTPQCVHCSVACGGRVDGDDVLLDADCDGEVANGCECAPSTIAIDATELPMRALFTPAGVLVVMMDLDTSNTELRTYDAAGGTYAVLRADVFNLDVVAHDGHVYGVELTADDSAIFEVTGTAADGDVALVDLVRFAAATDLRGSRIAVDDDAFYLLDRDGVFRVDRATLAATLLSDACVASTFGRLASCGDALACVSSTQSALFAIDKAGGDAEVLEQRETGVEDVPFVPHPACLDGALLWHDGVALYRRGEGGPLVVASLPQDAVGLVALHPLSFAVPMNGDVLLTVGSSIGAGQVSFAIDLERRSAHGLVAAVLLDATDDGAFFGYDPARDRLVVLP